MPNRAAIFEYDVRITTLAGVKIKLLDIMDDISGNTNIRDVKVVLSRAFACSMCIIKLLIGVEELSNAWSLSRFGQQGVRLNLTMVQSLHYCDEAFQELMKCLLLQHVNTDVVDELSGSMQIQMLQMFTAVLHYLSLVGGAMLKRFVAFATLAPINTRRRCIVAGIGGLHCRLPLLVAMLQWFACLAALAHTKMQR